MREKPEGRQNTLFAASLWVGSLVVAGLIALYPELLIALGIVAVGLGVAGGLVWWRGRPKKERPLTPTERAEAEASFARLNGFSLQPFSLGESPGQPVLAYVNVETVLGDEARNCRGRLIAVTRNGAARYRRLDIPLAWAQPDDPSNPTRKTFHGSARLNVATGTHNPNIMVPMAAFPLDVVDRRASEIPKSAEVLIGVEIAADNKSPTVGWFWLKWISEVPLPATDDQPARVWLLNYAQIEFEKAPDA